MKEVSSITIDMISQYQPPGRESQQKKKKEVDFFNLDELFKQNWLHISEPDLAHVDGPPHSSCPSSASFSSSSHIPSPELYPVRLQEVNLIKILFATIPNKS